ncbi:putative bifunctional diguanylate cyclase/phosphodiesterase [Edaphosphingomonas haloaromaticamans]|uniref:Phytochrome-like protein cph2 n=1 Tax=Edaphosphingomonas haloaromaticamans TaxID=653954 RepID=A0A1S1HAU3_9SPHN|nr:EAL domain-containing protein [Sphingomonas haloaromaticamans]OHT19208.1 Phytochrome-like protein cph2 [Sphingomonas haloaromaticamans]
MEGLSLKSRAVAFALSAGAVVFILALFAGTSGSVSQREIVGALLVAIVCGAMSWASAERAIAGVAEGVDVLALRIRAAAEGDLISPTPERVRETLPELAEAMDRLFGQVRANFDSVHALAMFDPVTQLANRVNFRRMAEQLLARRAPGQIAALLFIDLDRFKFVNDSMGHACGDEVLAMVGGRLHQVAARARQDMDAHGADAPAIGRLAGDEFTLLFPMVRDAGHAERLARRALHVLSEPFVVAGQAVDVGASIGLAIAPDHGTDLVSLMRAADIAMYHAKAQGRRQVQRFNMVLNDAAEERLRLERDLRRAIEGGEFELAFQPQMRMSGEVVAVEGLLRWRHPEDGLQMPGRFIQAAEDGGLIREIGDWVLDRALKSLAGWRGAGLGQRIAINISPRQMAQPGFFDRLRSLIAESGAPAEGLEIEITETLAMQGSDAVLAGLRDLRADGVAIAIDDFGTGYSNLARLKDMPIDRVKLDRTLIRDIADSADARTLVHSVVALVHGLGFQAVAEGVENQGQMDVLRAIGCDAVQGYAVARPMDEAAFLAWLAGRRDGGPFRAMA